MRYKSNRKITVDSQKKKEIAKQLPEPARDVLSHMPDNIEFERFIDHIILAEKLYMRARHKDEGTGPTASIIATIIIAIWLLLIPYYAFLSASEIEIITLVAIALAGTLFLLKDNISIKRSHALVSTIQGDYSWELKIRKMES